MKDEKKLVNDLKDILKAINKATKTKKGSIEISDGKSKIKIIRE
jgi:hypothetical protein